MRTLKALVCCVAVGVVAVAGSLATAQDGKPKQDEKPKTDLPRGGGGAGGGGGGGQPGGAGGGRPRQGGPGAALSAEKQKAAWELEATGVAKRLGVADDKIKGVATAYAEARASQVAALTKMREDLMKKPADKDDDKEGDAPRPRGGPEAMQAMEETNKAEREKLQKALGAALTPEQTTKAMKSLGTFNRQWDMMVDAVAGFNLEAAKQQSALEAIEDFVGSQEKVRSAGADGDREAMRTAMEGARAKLTEAIKKVLSEEQLTKFEELMGRGGRGMGGRPGGGGGGGGGG